MPTIPDPAGPSRAVKPSSTAAHDPQPEAEGRGTGMSAETVSALWRRWLSVRARIEGDGAEANDEIANALCGEQDAIERQMAVTPSGHGYEVTFKLDVVRNMVEETTIRRLELVMLASIAADLNEAKIILRSDILAPEPDVSAIRRAAA